MGIWKAVCAHRPSVALVFPRVLGAHMTKVEIDLPLDVELPLGYVRSADRPDRGALLPLTAGSFVYSPSEKGSRGELLMVWHSFMPQVEGREVDEENELRVSCAELLLVQKKSRPTVYKLDKRSTNAGGSFAPGRGQIAWELSAGLLYTVDHLVKVDSPLETTEAVPSPSAFSPRLVASSLESREFSFDYKRAEQEVSRLKDNLLAGGGWARPGQIAREVANLGHVLVGDAAEAASSEFLRQARVSADEAAALKKTVATPERAPQWRAVPILGGRKKIVCRYSAQRCEGCDKKFAFGEEIVAGVLERQVGEERECRFWLLVLGVDVQYVLVIAEGILKDDGF